MTHKRCLDCQARSNSVVNQQDVLLKEIFAITQGLTIVDIDSCGAAESCGPLYAEQEMWDNWMPSTDHAFKIEQGPEETLRNARWDFEHKIKAFRVWGCHETMLNSDEDMDNIQDAWNEVENDDILTEILQNLGQSKTYRLNSNLLQGILLVLDDSDEH